jgi:hypothetical protein
MKTLRSIPSALMSESPNVVYLQNCFDKYQGVINTVADVSTITFDAISPTLPTGTYKFSFVLGQSILEEELVVTSTTSTTIVGEALIYPEDANVPVTFYLVLGASATPFDLVITDTVTTETATIRVEPAPDGTARLELQELLKLFLVEPSKPDSGESSYNQLRGIFELVFNDLEPIEQTISIGNNLNTNGIASTNNLYSIRRQAFKDLTNAVLSYSTSSINVQHTSVNISALSAGNNNVEVDSDTVYFKLYNAVGCREPRYLSGYYGFDVDEVSPNGGILIDVSTVILAYIDQYGFYDYLRFSGNNSPFKAIQEATTIQRIGATLDNNTYTEYSNLGEVFEGIDLIATSDTNTNYIIDNLEQQRILDALNTAKYMWLCVPANGPDTKAIPVRVQRESVKYQGTFNNEPVTIQASILLNLPLRQIN